MRGPSRQRGGQRSGSRPGFCPCRAVRGGISWAISVLDGIDSRYPTAVATYHRSPGFFFARGFLGVCGFSGALAIVLSVIGAFTDDTLHREMMP